MCRCPIALAVEFRIVRFILLGHIVNCDEQHSGDGNNRFLVSSAFFESKVPISNLQELPDTDSVESALNE